MNSDTDQFAGERDLILALTSLNPRYTAKICYKGSVIKKITGGNIDLLHTQLLGSLEAEQSGMSGIIQDDHTGSIVYRCRKTTLES